MSGSEAPSRDDPLVGTLAEVVGGPLGDRAAPHPWWTPARVALLLVTVVLALGMVQKAPCATGGWPADRGEAALCTSGLPALYLDSGLAEGVWPFARAEDDRERWAETDLPPLTGAWSWVAARVTQEATGAGPASDRFRRPVEEVRERGDVRREARWFVVVNAIGLALLALLATWLVATTGGSSAQPRGDHDNVRTRLRRRGTWAGAAFALSPLLALTWLSGPWLVSVALVAAAAWAAHRRRPVVTGVLLALLLLSLVPTGATPLGGWISLAAVGEGSVWLLVVQAADVSFAASTVATWTLGLLALWAIAVTALALLHREAATTARVGLLLVAGLLLVLPTVPPAAALLLAPLAALTVERWRDLVVWQGAELVHLLLLGLYLAGDLAPTGGGDAVAYWVAIVVRVAGLLWLVGVVLRQVTTTRSNVVAV